MTGFQIHNFFEKRKGSSNSKDIQNQSQQLLIKLQLSENFGISYVFQKLLGIIF